MLGTIQYYVTKVQKISRLCATHITFLSLQYRYLNQNLYFVVISKYIDSWTRLYIFQNIDMWTLFESYVQEYRYPNQNLYLFLISKNIDSRTRLYILQNIDIWTIFESYVSEI